MLWGRGTVDMKGGVAVDARGSPRVTEPSRDVTFVFYESEEIDARAQRPAARRAAAPRAARRRRLRRAPRAHRRARRGRLPGHPAGRGVDQGHRARTPRGRGRAHNAIHDAADVLARLAAYEPRRPGSSTGSSTARGSTRSASPAASPATSSPTGASSRSTTASRPTAEDEAEAHVRQVFAGFEVDVRRRRRRRPAGPAPARRPGVRRGARPAGRGQAGLDRRGPLLGAGRPAVNFGPGDPNLAHMDDEQCPVEQYVACEAALLRWLPDHRRPSPLGRRAPGIQ